MVPFMLHDTAAPAIKVTTVFFIEWVPSLAFQLATSPFLQQCQWQVDVVTCSQQKTPHYEARWMRPPSCKARGMLPKKKSQGLAASNESKAAPAISKVAPSLGPIGQQRPVLRRSAHLEDASTLSPNKYGVLASRQWWRVPRINGKKHISTH